jgi:hypothetical protein
LNPRRTFQHVRDFQSRSFGRSDTSPGRLNPIPHTTTKTERGALTLDGGRHVRGDVLDLLLAQRVLEGRHHALSVRHPLDDLVVRR